MPELLMNVEFEKCMKGNGKDGKAVTLADCNPNDANQQFEAYSDNNQSNYWNVDNAKLYFKVADGYFNTFIDQKAYLIPGWCGTGTQQCRFKVNNTRGSRGGAGMKGGIFELRDDWDDRKNTIMSDDGTSIYRKQDDGTGKKFWILYSDYQQCQRGGIPKYECDKTNIDNCQYKNNYLKEECQPKVCTQADGTFLEHKECRDWCLNHPGMCDISVKAYCDKHPDDKGFCGCVEGHYADIDSKVTIKPDCNIRECISTDAYKFIGMGDNNCPSLNICNNEIDAKDLAKLGGVVTQNCNSTKKNSQDGSGNSDDSSDADDSDSAYITPTAYAGNNILSNPNMKTVLYVIIGIIVCFCSISSGSSILLALFTLMKKRR